MAEERGSTMARPSCDTSSIEKRREADEGSWAFPSTSTDDGCLYYYTASQGVIDISI